MCFVCNTVSLPMQHTVLGWMPCGWDDRLVKSAWSCFNQRNILTMGKNQTADPQPQDQLIAWLEDANKKIEEAIATYRQSSIDRERQRSAKWAEVIQMSWFERYRRGGSYGGITDDNVNLVTRRSVWKNIPTIFYLDEPWASQALCTNHGGRWWETTNDMVSSCCTHCLYFAHLFQDSSKALQPTRTDVFQTRSSSSSRAWNSPLNSKRRWVPAVCYAFSTFSSCFVGGYAKSQFKRHQALDCQKDHRTHWIWGWGGRWICYGSARGWTTASASLTSRFVAVFSNHLFSSS